MKHSLFSKTFFAILLAFTLSSFLYFSFANIYSSGILNHADYQEQFQAGIYQYRILSSSLLLGIYNLLSSFNIDYNVFKLKFLDPDSEPQMYLSFYLLNTLFLGLSAWVLVLITNCKTFSATEIEKTLLVAVAVFAMVISQFVIVPYDISSYFFLLVFIYVFLRYLEKPLLQNLILLVITVIISTLNRETAVLSLALAASLLYTKYGFKREFFNPVSILSMAFIAVYFALRLAGENFTTNDGNLFLQNFTQPKNVLGLLFWIVLFWLSMFLAKDKESKKNIMLFHFVSIPYLAACFYTGIIYEIRLYIPIFLTSLIISRTAIIKIH